MGWVWVAPTAAAVTGIVGVFFTWLAGKQGRDLSAQLVRESQVHDLAMARYARRADAYLEALDVVSQVGNWIQSVSPIADTNPPRELPPVPEVPTQARASAFVLAYGSRTAHESMEAWRDAVQEVSVASMLLRFEQEHPSFNGALEDSPWGKLQAAKASELASREALGDLLHSELAGEGPSETPPPK